MNLPNYFIADLPREAHISPEMLGEACRTLRRNRERYLATRSTESIVGVLAGVGERWLSAENSFRKLALEQGPAETGFSSATLSTGLDALFKQLTRPSLMALIEQDLGHARRLDDLVATGPEANGNRASIATAPELLVHITAGNIPNPTLSSIVMGVLTRSAQFVKCATGASWLPRLFAHSLYEAEPKLGACLEIAEWKGGHGALDDALFAEADCVTVTGSDETLAAIRHRLPSRVRFLGYGHRVSFGYVCAAVLKGLNVRRIAARAAADVAAWNQLGCLSPHLIYVETGGGTSPDTFAEMLAEELARREESEPRGELSIHEAAGVSSRRAFYETRAAHSPETRMWHSQGSTAWTVVFEVDPKFQLSCLNRFIYVKAVSSLDDALANADAVRGRVSTVGLAAPEEKAQEYFSALARWGAGRVCPLGQMQHPPIPWRHDGRPALGDLVTWTDWEMQ